MRSDFFQDPFERERQAMEGAELAVKIFSIWLTLVLGFILLPSAFGVSLGISEIYMKILVKTLEVSASREAASLHLRALDVESGEMEAEDRIELTRGDHFGRSAVRRSVRFGLSSKEAPRQPPAFSRELKGSRLRLLEHLIVPLVNSRTIPPRVLLLLLLLLTD